MLQSIRDGDRLIVRIDGELDHFCAQSVRRDLDALLLDRSIRTLILDFSSLTFMDSSFSRGIFDAPSVASEASLDAKRCILST